MTDNNIEIGNRIKQIRNALNMNMANFSSKLGMSHAAISLLESGKRNLSTQTATSICREFNVNETWLRTGEGDMFNPKDKEDEISEIAANIFHDSEDDPFKYELTKIISKMSAEQIELFKAICIKLYDAIIKEDRPE